MRVWQCNNNVDARFLLRFLRFKKFSIIQAREALERYILLRQTFGIAFNNLDITIPMMEQLVDLGYMFPSPMRDSKGRRVIINRPGRALIPRFFSVLTAVFFYKGSSTWSASPTATCAASTASPTRHSWRTRRTRSGDSCTLRTGRESGFLIWRCSRSKKLFVSSKTER